MIALCCAAALLLPSVALRSRAWEGEVQDPAVPSILPPYWLHIPKCGSSFATAIAHLVCGDSIPERARVVNPSVFFSKWSGACPKDKFLDFLGSHKPLPQDRPEIFKNVVVMVREPMQRILSGYYARPQEPLHDCPRLQEKYHCETYGDGQCDGDIQKDGRYITNPDVIPPVEYAECVQNCATNMLTGFRCDSPDPPNVSVAVATLKKLGFVGLTGEWELTVCLWHAKFGGQPLMAELANGRPGPLSQSAYDAKGLLGDWQATSDLAVYQAARELFDAELQRHNLTAETCNEWIASVGAKSETTKHRGLAYGRMVYDED